MVAHLFHTAIAACLPAVSGAIFVPCADTDSIVNS